MNDNNPELFYLPKLHFSTPSKLHLEHPVYLHSCVLEQDLIKYLMVQTLPGKDLLAALITNYFLFRSLGFSVSQSQRL